MDKRGHLIEESKRAGLAEQLMANELWSGTWAAHREQCIAAWERARAPEDRERLWMEMQIARKFQARIESFVRTGKMAQIELTKMEQTDVRNH